MSQSISKPSVSCDSLIPYVEVDFIAKETKNLEAEAVGHFLRPHECENIVDDLEVAYNFLHIIPTRKIRIKYEHLY